MSNDQSQELTESEKQLILKIVSQIQVAPLDNGAEELVASIRSIARKLAPKAKE